MTQRLDPLEIVNRPSTVKEQNTGMLAPKQYAGTSWKDLERQRLAGGGLQLGQDFVTKDIQGRTDDRDLRGVEFGVGEDIVGYDRDYVGSDFENQRRMSAEGQLGTFQDAGTSQRLGALGLQQNYKQNQYKGYKYNSTTGKYDYYDNTPSNLEMLAPILIKAGVMGVATGGLGGALSSGLGVSTGIGKAIASTGLNAMFGEDLNIENTIKNLAVSYGLEQFGELSTMVDTGSEFTDDVVKDTVTAVARGKDPKEAVLKSVLKQSGEYVADALDLGEEEDSFFDTLSEIDKEYLQPVKEYVEEALGVDFSEAYDEIKEDVDGFLEKVPDPIKNIVERFAKFKLGETVGGFQQALASQGNGVQGISSFDNPLLADEGVTLTDYETLDNNLLQQLQI